MTQRQPKGIPVGGQFAANTHDESSSDLGAENDAQKRVREAVSPIREFYPNAHVVYILANTSNPYDDDDHWDDGETLIGQPRIDGIYDEDGLCIWDQVLSRRDLRLERIEDTFADITRYSDLPCDRDAGSSRGTSVGIELHK